MPALVERLGAGAPYPDVDAVIAQARAIVRGMSEHDRVALLDAHPRLGAPRDTLSAVSAREQNGGADDATLAELRALNDEYERRFGFRCVIFVAGRPLAALLPAIRERLANDRAAELARGVDEFLAIARDRLARA